MIRIDGEHLLDDVLGFLERLATGELGGLVKQRGGVLRIRFQREVQIARDARLAICCWKIEA